jgi:TatD DNase family protein
LSDIRYVDSHAHLIGREHENDRYLKPRLERAANLGVAIITVAQVPRLWEPTLKLISDYDNVFAVLGVSHSEAAKLETFERLVRLCKEEPGIVGIGEIGLDYRQGKPPDLLKRKDQLREHVHVAREVNLPLVIHDGKATEDILAILDEEAASDVGGMIHFFTGNLKQVSRARELGFSISFGGPHTYAKPLIDLVRSVQLEYLLVETDSPMLAPPKSRRKEHNEPSFVVDVVKGLAELRGMDSEKLREITTNNAIKLFKLDEG